MTYRERRLHKAERLREWAGGRDAKSEAALGRADAIAEQIPFGQPILVGHHSEGRARRDQERIERGMRAGFEHSRKAEDMRSRAENIERAAEHAIYSDDVDAVDRLRERIAELEAERDRIKAYNAACRKAGDGPGPLDGKRLMLLDAKQREELIGVARLSSYQLGKGGAAPAYWSANLSGNIARQRKRLAELEERATRGAMS